MKTSKSDRMKRNKLKEKEMKNRKKNKSKKLKENIKSIKTTKNIKFTKLNDQQKINKSKTEDLLEDTGKSNLLTCDENASVEVIKMLKNIKERKAKQRIMDNQHSKTISKMTKDLQDENNSPKEKCIDIEHNQNRSLLIRKKNKFYKKLRENLEEANTAKKPAVSLRTKMLEKLKAARFRFLNEQIYTINSKETQKIFNTDPDAYKAYHEGYRNQVKKWPVNPVDVIIKNIKKMPNWYKIADLGCGDAQIAKSVEQQVHSFDLIAVDESVTACDMANLPLENGSMDVVIFCLSLMGTNLNDYIMEANRILKTGGMVKIAEVESRFENVDEIIKNFQKFGFRNVWRDLSHNLFYFLDFTKVHNIKNKNKLPALNLLPCLYKKR